MISSSRLRVWRDNLRDPSLAALFALQAVVLFLITPLEACGVSMPTPGPAILVFVAASIVVVVSKTKYSGTFGAISLIVSIIGEFFCRQYPSVPSEIIGSVGEIVALAALGKVVGAAVFGPGRITSARILGAIVLYLNLAMMFGALYRILYVFHPNSFVGFPSWRDDAIFNSNLYYFSFTTLTCTGFGDILPIHPLARSLANLEAVVGQLYPATLLARVVGLHLQEQRSSLGRAVSSHPSQTVGHQQASSGNDET